jgi:hypothetical protein
MSSTPNSQPQTRSYDGSCHCGAVRFKLEADLSKGGSHCNCSICTKIAPTGHTAKPSAFTLVAGEDALSTYQWGSKMSTRYFCKHCGVHCFGRGHLEQLGGDFVSVNLNCLDGVDVSTLPINYWDGRHNNWSAGTRSTPWPIA